MKIFRRLIIAVSLLFIWLLVINQTVTYFIKKELKDSNYTGERVSDDTLSSSPALAEIYSVERVIDGNTLKLTNGHTVRLRGVQIPEGEKMGQEATEFVRGLIKPGQEVKLEFDVQERDKYGRLLAYVFTREDITFAELDLLIMEGVHYVVKEDNKEYLVIFINAWIVDQGYASPMTIPPNVKYAELFKEL